MKSKLSHAFVLLLTGTIAFPAHIFAQTQTPDLAASVRTLNHQSQKLEAYVTQWMGQNKSEFSLSPATRVNQHKQLELTKSMSPYEVSGRVQKATLHSFYALAPFDPALQTRLGLKAELMSATPAGYSMSIEVMHNDSKTNSLVSFERPVQKLIEVNFATSTTTSVQLEIDQTSKAAYQLAVKRMNSELGLMHTVGGKAANLFSSIFLPSARADIVSDGFTNVFYEVIQLLSHDLAIAVTAGVIFLKMAKVEIKSWKPIYVLYSVAFLAMLTKSFYLAYKNTANLAND